MNVPGYLRQASRRIGLAARTARRTSPRARRGGRAIDYGSPFDAAYGLEADGARWLPEPLATSSAGLATPPRQRRQLNLGRLLVASEVVLISTLVGYAVATPGTNSQVATEVADTAATQRVASGPAELVPPRVGVPVVMVRAGARSSAMRTQIALTKGLGYPIVATVNIGGTLERSAVMYLPGMHDQALAVARDLGMSRVIPVSGIARGVLGHAGIAIVIGRDGARQRPSTPLRVPAERRARVA